VLQDIVIGKVAAPEYTLRKRGTSGRAICNLCTDCTLMFNVQTEQTNHCDTCSRNDLGPFVVLASADPIRSLWQKKRTLSADQEGNLSSWTRPVLSDRHYWIHLSLIHCCYVLTLNHLTHSPTRHIQSQHHP
jgi:hypothetical protein